MGWLALLMVSLSLATIVHTWTLYDQTTEENEHIAAAMEMLVNWIANLDWGHDLSACLRYTLGPDHLCWVRFTLRLTLSGQCGT